MKSVFKRLMTVLLILTVIGQSVQVQRMAVYAADNILNIYLGSSKIARYHKALTPGEQTEEVSFALESGTVKSSSYVSNNTKCFKIVKTSEGKCIVEALKEGTGLVTLTVKTTEGDTYTQKLFISVYTTIENHIGITNKNTNAYMGASDNSGVESYDNKGDIENDTQLLITASCENYYLIKTLDGTTFKGGRDTGFVKKSDVDIVTDSLKINESDTSIKLGDSVKFSTTVKPDMIEEKDVIWNSSDEKIAMVNATGQVSAKSEGTVSISAFTKGTMGKNDSIYISVYSSMNDTTGCLNTDSELYKVANDKILRGKGKKGNGLTITGQCGNYYRVKMKDTLLYEDGISDEYCYILKNNISIPVQAIKLNYSNLTLQPGDKIKLEAIITPEQADNKKTIWKSSDKKIVAVNDSGMIEAVKTGEVVITVETDDGMKTAECTVTVEQNNNTEKSSYKRPKMKAEAYGFNMLLVEVSSINGFDGFDLYVDGEFFQSTNCPKKNQSNHGVVFTGIEINKKHRIKARPFIYNKKNGKKVYQKFSNSQTIVLGRLNINVIVTGKKEITVKWNQLAGATSYEIYRATKKNGKYQLIKTLKSSRTSFKDKGLKTNKVYYYKARAILNNKIGKMSKVQKGKPFMLKKVEAYFAKKYPNICLDKTKNINSYNINGYYSPIKYKYAKGTLQIHVYLEFATYKYSGKRDAQGNKIYDKNKPSVKSEISASKYISMFKKGVVKAYSDQKVVGNENDFKPGINFNTKLIIHEKKKGKKYNKKQQFIEVMIGGECPNCTSEGDHWYHAGPNKNAIIGVEYANEYVIYMPTNEQVRKNMEEGYSSPTLDYESTSAHELGHVLGLDDAYYNGVDRCADNRETAYEYDKKLYDNIMKHHNRYKVARANDIEMMLTAYNRIDGVTSFASQSYKRYKGHKFSKAIKNKKDYQKDGK